MARQGHRVWASRLVVCCILLAAIVAVTSSVLWQKFANESGVVKIESASPVSPSADAVEPAHALDPLLDFARKAFRNHLQNHRDYTAILVKRERVDGKLVPETKMALKLKYGRTIGTESPYRPVSVYLKSLEPKSQAGREVIWVQGRNDNKLTAHEAGLLGLLTVNLLPESRLAMIGNRYPITEIGIERLLGKLIEKGERDRQLGPATIRTTENVTVGDRSCRLMEVIHETPTTIVDGKTVDFEYFLAQIYIDDERLIPLKYASFGWPKAIDGSPELLEEYTYENLAFNVGLKAIDFDPKNPAYGF